MKKFPRPAPVIPHARGKQICDRTMHIAGSIGERSPYIEGIIVYNISKLQKDGLNMTQNHSKDFASEKSIKIEENADARVN